MSDDPQRLLASVDASDLEKDLLRSWESERPSPAAREATLAMLGVAGAAGGLVAAGGSIAPKAVTAAWLAIAKWTALGGIAISAAAGGTYALVHYRTTHDAAQATPSARLVGVPVAIAPVETQTASTIELEQPGGTKTARAIVRTTAPASSTLAQQVAAVDRARAALESGDAARAKRLIETYEAEYPGGAFVQEAEVVRVDALLREGNRAEAERIGKRFLAAYPKSPHAARVRALIGQEP